LACDRHYGWGAGRRCCSAYNLTDALDLADRRSVRNFACLWLVLLDLIDLRRRGIRNLNCAAADKRAAASASTKFR
jgi:hypothetical protein